VKGSTRDLEAAIDTSLACSTADDAAGGDAGGAARLQDVVNTLGKTRPHRARRFTSM